MKFVVAKLEPDEQTLHMVSRKKVVEVFVVNDEYWIRWDGDQYCEPLGLEYGRDGVRISAVEVAIDKSPFGKVVGRFLEIESRWQKR